MSTDQVMEEASAPPLSQLVAVRADEADLESDVTMESKQVHTPTRSVHEEDCETSSDDDEEDEPDFLKALQVLDYKEESELITGREPSLFFLPIYYILVHPFFSQKHMF